VDRDPILLENNVSPESPLAELATLAAGIALIGLGLLCAAWLAVEGVVRWLPASVEERAFGASWNGAYAAEDDARVAELDALLRRLARHWPGHGYALHIAVTDAPEPNAFALPGGNLLVTSALLAQTGSENELAFVLAHELGHVAGRDPLRALGRGVLLGLALAALGGADGSALAGSAAALGERAFSREQESAADRFALALVAAEYGHVQGATDFLRRLPDAGEAGAAERAAGWLATHPRSADRVAELDARARAEGYATTGVATPLAGALRRD
jgi:predicted Zn-dependent protease